MIPVWAKEIVFYYGVLTALAIIFLLRRRPRLGMRLKLRGTGGARNLNLAGAESSSRSPERFSHIQAAGERPLNVVFNYNGHSWDAYEVLGLPAGSALENVDRAYQEALKSVDSNSHGFIHAAHDAIQSQWRSYRATGNG